MGNKPEPKADRVEALLPSKRELALEHLLSGMSSAETARALDIGKTTIWRWLQDPLFAGELMERRAGRRDDAARFLDSQVEPSLRVLVEVRDADGVKPEVRLRAAEMILDRALGKPISTPVEAEMSDDELDAWLAEQMGADQEADEQHEEGEREDAEA
jgi:transposase-like protein